MIPPYDAELASLLKSIDSKLSFISWILVAIEFMLLLILYTLNA